MAQTQIGWWKYSWNTQCMWIPELHDSLELAAWGNPEMEENVPCLSQKELNCPCSRLMNLSRCQSLAVVCISCAHGLIPGLLCFHSCHQRRGSTFVRCKVRLYNKANRAPGSSCSRSDGKYMGMSQRRIRTKTVIHETISNVHVGMCWIIRLEWLCSSMWRWFT